MSLSSAVKQLLPLVLLAGVACRRETALYDRLGPRYEARAWLSTNANPAPFASNRFDSAGAAAFVDSLYRLGADTVYVVNVKQDPAWVRREGGPYADALLLRLPTDASRRERLFTIGAREARREGFGPDADTGQRYLYFWWD